MKTIVRSVQIVLYTFSPEFGLKVKCSGKSKDYGENPYSEGIE